MHCENCNSELIKKNNEWYCPNRKFYNYWLHQKSHHGYIRHPLPYESTYSFAQTVLARICRIFSAT
jgi:hypothetical protein